MYPIEALERFIELHKEVMAVNEQLNMDALNYPMKAKGIHWSHFTFLKLADQLQATVHFDPQCDDEDLYAWLIYKDVRIFSLLDRDSEKEK